MHFSKLRLIGFKSFVEPVDFHIEPGLTGVVGPNGCGKSNLVEALRWVMGENSFKNMRASGMDDVIFSGAGDRPGRNVAEVGLTLDNSTRSAPAAFNDSDVLEITRRIEREQGSTYRINGREVRARDVQILFADASTGARSPSLVRQGQISEIIAAKPQARRRILEEAAGIAGLHTRRHEAELRLKAAEDNLARIDDVMTQIGMQGDALRRQVRQAQRYKDLQAEIRRTHALAILIDYEEAQAEVAAAEARLVAANAEVVERTRAQAEATRLQAVAAHALPELRERENGASAALQRVTVARETLDGEERRAKGRLAELERRISEMSADLERDNAALEDAASMLARLNSEEADLASGVGTAETENELRRTLEAAEALRITAEAAVAEAQTNHAEADARRRALEERLREETARIIRFEREFELARQGRAALEGSLDLGDGLEAAAARLAELTAAVGAAETNARDQEHVLAAARESVESQRGPLAEADRRAQRLQTEVATLTKLLEAGSGARWQPITDSITVAKGYETALGAALGDDLDASADPSAPAHWAEVEAFDDATLPVGAEPLLQFVDSPLALRRRLAQVGIVDRNDGPSLRAQLRPGQRLVSREGDIWRWDGFTQAAEAPTPAARRLAEKNRLAELREDSVTARDKHESLRHQSELAQTNLKDAGSAEQAARADLQTARRAFESAREAHAQLERRLNEASAKLASFEVAENSSRAARDEAITKRGEIELAVRDLAPLGDLVLQIETTKGKAAEHRADETEVRSSLQSIAREREAKERRLAAIANDKQSWNERSERAANHRIEIETRLTESRAEHEEMANAPDRFALARREILNKVEAAEQALREASDARAAAESSLKDADHEARTSLDAMAEAREEKARSEARGEAATQRLEIVVRTAAVDLECSPPALLALCGLKPDQPRPGGPQISAKLESLKADRERLGAVNLRAEEELATIDEQRETLDKEKSDLTEAIRRLRQAIGSLNREGRERLLGAFDTVNEHFKGLFTSLFGGGTAELQLVESDDPLEAGLEIVARPPGKKPQVMTLLSGGEQALTAISLIFAVFLTNPSPICVLDEVDAPLDDANVERFCDLVDEMRKKTDTRFIAITHNPITMARMDRLFGVTQAEQGISQLVSVDLVEAEELLEAS